MRKILFVAAIVLAACRGAETPAKPVAKATPKPVKQKAPEAVDVGTQIPAYTAKWLDGKPFDLASQKGNVVLLNLWATWCGPCRFEIPELGKLHDKYSSRGFEVIGVSVDEGGADDVRPFLKETKISYPIVVDPEGKLAEILQTNNLPTSVLLDKSGSVVWKHIGIVDTSDPLLTRALETALTK
ncbi:MAG TPA: TlpA disulfide reductase family protein [Thermoanaerobaculia bacterium]|nr:TlpA disulfide reductase family protein [Thermoanaerobaculia bacterium]